MMGEPTITTLVIRQSKKYIFTILIRSEPNELFHSRKYTFHNVSPVKFEDSRGHMAANLS